MYPNFAIIGWSILVVMVEIGMWMLFKHRVVRVCFPADHETEQGSVRKTFGVKEIHTIAIIHTIFLLCILCLIYLFLW